MTFVLGTSLPLISALDSQLRGVAPLSQGDLRRFADVKLMNLRTVSYVTVAHLLHSAEYLGSLAPTLPRQRPSSGQTRSQSVCAILRACWRGSALPSECSGTAAPMRYCPLCGS